MIGKMLRPYWRLTRGMTLGAQAVVVDDQNRVLLVRHGYRPGWHFPGGGVERSETLETGMIRELNEETGVIAASGKLHGIFANFKAFPGDHIAVFIVTDWQQPVIPEPNMEIASQNFYSLDMLPEDTDPGTRNRLQEIFNNETVSPHWK